MEAGVLMLIRLIIEALKAVARLASRKQEER